MKGQPPKFTLVMPKTEQQERAYIGGEWETSRSEIFSCRIKLPFDLRAGEEISFIRVPYEPKEPQPINQPTKAAKQLAKPKAAPGPRPAA